MIEKKNENSTLRVPKCSVANSHRTCQKKYNIIITVTSIKGVTHKTRYKMEKVTNLRQYSLLEKEKFFLKIFL